MVDMPAKRSSIWDNFDIGKMVNVGFKLEYVAPSSIDSNAENGVVLVRFDTTIWQNEIIQVGIYHLYRLDFKYWSPKFFIKLGSLLGKPLMVDQNSERKVVLNFATLMVEVDMDTTLPKTISLKNEKGQLIEQKKYVHLEEIYKKKNIPKAENKRWTHKLKLEENTYITEKRMKGQSKERGVAHHRNCKDMHQPDNLTTQVYTPVHQVEKDRKEPSHVADKEGWITPRKVVYVYKKKSVTNNTYKDM
ncbi:hypothetical protein H5410_016171 [Solanum commersonii]|uniref:DUF4283 domain-containing protein n=1 Tax=Solanum commersonii TaxID=4109 RepID=A0A9J5ZW94_SOLCO|nr:hypothetical protein H5410_016171 [Solanum commersonii]